MRYRSAEEAVYYRADWLSGWDLDWMLGFVFALLEVQWGCGDAAAGVALTGSDCLVLMTIIYSLLNYIAYDQLKRDCYYEVK